MFSIRFKCSRVTVIVRAVLSLSFKTYLMTQIEFNVSVDILFFFFVFASDIRENTRSASAFEWERVLTTLRSNHKFGKWSSSSSVENKLIFIHISSKHNFDHSTFVTKSITHTHINISILFLPIFHQLICLIYD